MSTDPMDMFLDDFDWSQWLQDESPLTASETQASLTNIAAVNPGHADHMDYNSSAIDLRPNDTMDINDATPYVPTPTHQAGVESSDVCDRIDNMFS